MNVMPSSGTGPFRRVLARAGFAYEAAEVTLPGRDAIHTLAPDGHLKPSGDTVFAYLGGTSPGGGEADAGLQYNADNDDWALFLAASGFGYTSGPAPGEPPHPRLASGQTVRLEFQVVGPDVLEVRAAGRDVTGTRVALAVRVDVSTFPRPHADLDRAGGPTHFGWDPAGRGNRLKRLTCIAQTPGHEDLCSGSFVRGIGWAGCVLGVAPAAAVPWSAANTGGFGEFPGSGVVTVEFVSHAQETVSITL